MLEVHAIVECVAPAALHADRFLPQTPVRVVVDHEQNDIGNELQTASASLRSGDPSRLLDKEGMKSRLIPSMIDTALEIAAGQMQTIIDAAVTAMKARLGEEIERLEDLHQINSNVDIEEIEATREQRSALEAAIRSARLRVGGLRLILRLP